MKYKNIQNQPKPKIKFSYIVWSCQKICFVCHRHNFYYNKDHCFLNSGWFFVSFWFFSCLIEHHHRSTLPSSSLLNSNNLSKHWATFTVSQKGQFPHNNSFNEVQPSHFIFLTLILSWEFCCFILGLSVQFVLKKLIHVKYNFLIYF